MSIKLEVVWVKWCFFNAIRRLKNPFICFSSQNQWPCRSLVASCSPKRSKNFWWFFPLTGTVYLVVGFHFARKALFWTVSLWGLNPQQRDVNGVFVSTPFLCSAECNPEWLISAVKGVLSWQEKQHSHHLTVCMLVCSWEPNIAIDSCEMGCYRCMWVRKRQEERLEGLRWMGYPVRASVLVLMHYTGF